MLRIITGGFGSIAYDEFKNEIRTLAEGGKRTILLVPEQQAVIAEREFVSMLSPNTALNFEVTNFTRLANTVYRTVGGIFGEYTSPAKEALLMWKTLTELTGHLDLTSRSEINTGMVEKTLSAVDEMKGLGITPKELIKLSESGSIENTSRLSKKVNDLSLIMSLYTEILNERYKSAKDECERLAIKLFENPEIFSDSHIYISGFTSFTEPQYKVIGELIKASTVTVHLTIPKSCEDSFEFSEIKKTLEHLSAVSDRLSVRKELYKKDAPSQSKNPVLQEICSLLWKSYGKIDNESLHLAKKSLKLYEASDTYEECDFVASDIKKRIMEGARFSDFAIVARDSDKYTGILDTVLSGSDIPYFISRKRDIDSFEAIKLIYSAFAIIIRDFAREDVISYAKCSLSGISAEACDEFELYSELWQINGSRFYDGDLWNMSPSGYETRKPDKEAELLLKINETRRIICEPILKFKENLESAVTVADYALSLFTFLTDISLEERIAKKVDTLISIGEHELADETSRLWEIISASLDELVEVLSDTKINKEGFLNQLKIVFKEADVGRIPAFKDEVTIGSADMLRLSEKKYVYLIGVNYGEFPKNATPVSYFSERDKEVLKSCGLSVDTDGNISYARELYFFSRAFTSPNECVTLTYSVRNASFESAKRADVIDRIKEITNGNIIPKKISSLSLDERLYIPSMTLEFARRQDVGDALVEAGFIREYGMTKKNISNEKLSLDKDTASILYPADLSLSQTRIDTYVDCPFSYYLKYNIKLSENEKAKFDARNIGTFIHAILENLFRDLKVRGERLADIGDDRKNELIERCAKEYIYSVVDERELKSKRTAIMIDRLSKAALPIVDSLKEEFADCAFTPEYFELKLEGDNECLPNPATFEQDGKKTYVYGSIDRTDTYRYGNDVYVRVIDYKTGQKTFSPTDLDEGKNLQMFIYLKAIVDTDNERFKKELGVGEGGRIIPAGVIYVKTDMSDVSISHADSEAERLAIAKNQERRGMILNDAVSIGAMNSKFVPVKFTKSGIDKRYEKYLYDEEGWKTLNEKISDTVKEVSSGMRGGNIAASADAHSSVCENCKFKVICRK